MAASRAKLAGLHDTIAIVAMPDCASIWHCAAAPLRGGSRMAMSKPSNSSGINGASNKLRLAVFTCPPMPVASTPNFNAARASSFCSTARRLAILSSNGRLSVPHPAKRSTIWRADPAISAMAFCKIVSPSRVACKKAPGGGETPILPN